MSDIGNIHQKPNAHVIRGGGFDRRKKRKSNQDQYSNRKGMNNVEPTENDAECNTYTSDASSVSEQAPKKKRSQSIDMQDSNETFGNSENGCTIENEKRRKGRKKGSKNKKGKGGRRKKIPRGFAKKTGILLIP